MTFHELIHTFNESLKVNIELNDEGVYTLEIDGFTLTFIDDTESSHILLTGDVGLPPQNCDLGPLYHLFLQSQHLFEDTEGATFSLHPESHHVILCRALPLTILDTETFLFLVEQFVNLLEGWSTIIKNYNPALPIDTTEVNPFDAFHNQHFLRI